MKKRNDLIPMLLVIAGLLGPVGLGQAADEETSSQKTEKSAKSVQVAAAMPVFVPQNRGAPSMRLGGATRSARQPDAALPRIEALVPEQPGWTLQAQPVLYWYLDSPTDVPLEFGLQRVDPLQQVVKTRISRPKQAGVQRIRLADHGVNLEPGAIYFWFVKLAPDANDPEQDRIVGGGIRRVAAPDTLQAELSDPSTSRPHALAKAGIWYDTVDAYSTAIEAGSDPALEQQRAELLKQVHIDISKTR